MTETIYVLNYSDIYIYVINRMNYCSPQLFNKKKYIGNIATPSISDKKI